MRVFIDFEASSLGKQGVPIEVAWVRENGAGESHLIRPAPGWTDWDPAAEAIHGISRDMLLAEGADHRVVARRMVDELSGHQLFASAPSWDGKWLSALLRAAALPRHALRLRDTDEAHRAVAEEALAGATPGPARDEALAAALRHGVSDGRRPAHRALADARDERDRWDRVRLAAIAAAEGLVRPA